MLPSRISEEVDESNFLPGVNAEALRFNMLG